MANLLVTGGAGFIGAHFVAHWLSGHSGGRIVVVDALTYAGNRANLDEVQGDPRFRFVHSDICDFETIASLLREERIDTVVNFAAETHVDRSIATAREFIRTNVMGTHSLLEAARCVWSRDEGFLDGVRFHQVSTDEVYGSLSDGEAPFTEQHPFRPSSPYSASKAAADHLAGAYFRTHGLPVTTTHSSNNFGPLQFPEKLIPLCIVNALQGLPLPLYGRGENLRDWLYVVDHCRGIDLALQHGRPGRTYNLGSATERRNVDLVRLLCRFVDLEFEGDGELRDRYPACPAARGEPCESLIQFVADRPGHDFRYALDCSRASRELGFVAAHDLESGLEKTVRWYLRRNAPCS